MKKYLFILFGLFVSSANAGLVLEENFDPITSSNWNISGGTVQGAGNTEFFDGNALHFSGSGNRVVDTIGFDLSSGGEISFVLKIGGPNDTSFFENANDGEDILFNYSIDGGSSWVNIFTFDTENLSFRDVWGTYSHTLAGATISTNTMFQWKQVKHSGSSYDHWAIDNVNISNNVSAVPEPATLALVGLGLAGIGFSRKKRTSIKT